MSEPELEEDLDPEPPGRQSRVSGVSVGTRRSMYSERSSVTPNSPSSEKTQGIMSNPEDQKRVQRLVSDVADLRREWDKLKTDFMSEREQIRDHVTSFESVVVNQVQTFSQHTSQVLQENKDQVRQEIENRRKEAIDIVNVINTMKLSVDRESFERMEQQEQVGADIQATLERIEQVRKDFLTQISVQSANIDNILAALDAVKNALGQEQNERLVKYEQIDCTFEQFLGIKATLEAELKEHQRDAKELLSMMNAMSKKQDLDSYERIMHEEQVRNWFAETNEKVQSIRAEALGMIQQGDPDTNEGSEKSTPSIGDELLRRRRPSKERIQPRAIRDGSFEHSEEGEPREERRSSIGYNPGLTGVTRQLHEERQARQKAIEDLQSRCDEMNHEIGRLEVIPQELETRWRKMLAEEQKRWAQSKELLLRCKEILAEERKALKEPAASAQPVLDVPKLELRWKEMLAEERKQWSESSASPLEGRVSRLEAALEKKAAPDSDASSYAASTSLSLRMDNLASELRDELRAHNARLTELAAEGKLAKQALEGEAKRAVNAEEAAAQTALALEKRLLSMQQRAEHELQSLREAVGNLRQLIADNQRTPTETSRQLQQQAVSVNEDRLLAVQQRFEEELDKRTSDLQKRLADIDSQLVGQREAEDQDGNDRYAVLQQSLDTLIASLAQNGQALGQSENDDLLEKASTSSIDEAELRRVSKNEFNTQTQSLWSAVKQLQQHVETPVEDQKEESSTSASTASHKSATADGRRALVASTVPGSTRPARASSGTRPTRSLSGARSAVGSASGPSLVGARPGSASGPSNPGSAYMIMSTPVARQRSSDSPSPFRQRPPASATALPVGASSNSTAVYAQQRSQPSTPTGFVGTPRSASRVLNASSPLVSRSFSSHR
mmetsp:Transcript_49650/g.93096  ORF Transcript_49650/g.93096 Transcript_49650/m.93096 type:complete len:901 (-) Transcript_49650:44-2746(-)